jgi:hypothetical protein
MRTLSFLLAVSLATFCVARTATGQRHSRGSSPPTAPHPVQHPALPIVAVSSGLGALPFSTVNYGVPAPQSLTRQLQADDDRTRAGSLSAIGAPAQYLVHGHIPYPHSTELDFIALGATEDLDAILTVELDQHMVSAILIPEDGNWKRIATVLYPTAFTDPTITPSTFLRVARALIPHEHYRAIFHATSTSPNGDFVESEAHLRIINNRAVITISFVSNARACDLDHRPPGHGGKPGCELTHRWLQTDASDPTHRFLLVSATGHLNPREAADPLAGARTFQMAHLRSFACQPYLFNDATGHYEPTANSEPCPTPALTPPH